MTLIALSTAALIAAVTLLRQALAAGRQAPLGARLARSSPGAATRIPPLAARPELPAFLERLRGRYERDLRRAGQPRTLRRFLLNKLFYAGGVPLVPLLPYFEATGRVPSPLIVAALAAVGSFVPDLVLRAEVRKRREEIFLDLPEVISVLALSLGAGQSLRRALELAGRDCPGAIGQEIQRALSAARRDRDLSDRDALVQAARDAGEPSFLRFTELLAAKESPYLDFLRQQAASARAEQSRYLERAADRAYLSMHAPIVPLLAILVLLIAYGFLHFLAQTI
jgi:Flp pilus assembly protein TadB